MKNTIKAIVIIFIFVSLILSYLFYFEEYSGSIIRRNEIKIISHRGYGNYAPDNAFKSAETALADVYDGVDMDVQMTKDGHLVVFHDLSLDRLTATSGKVKDFELAEMENLDLGPKFNEQVSGYYVRSFEDFIKELVGKNKQMIFELKATGVSDTGMEKQAVEILNKYDAKEKVILSSFNPFVIYRLEKLEKDVNTMFIFMDTNWNEDLLAEMKKEDVVNLPFFLRNEFTRSLIRQIIKPDFLSINFTVSESTLDKLLKMGYPVFIWTPNSKEELNYAFSKKPYGIISDEILIMKSIKYGN